MVLRAKHHTKFSSPYVAILAWMRALAIPDVCYLLGFLILASGCQIQKPEMLFATLALGWGAFIFDRVKVHPWLTDPADAASDPDRTIVFTRFPKLLRCIAWLLVLIAVVSFTRSPNMLMGVLPILGLCAVVMYGVRVRYGEQTVGLKAVPLLKNVVVTSAYGVALFIVSPDTTLWVLITATVAVCADAILCDLPDCSSDAQHGIRSLPVLIGVTRARVVAGALHIAALILAASVSDVCLMLIPLSGLLVVVMGAIRKEVVDSRLGVLGLIALLL